MHSLGIKVLYQKLLEVGTDCVKVRTLVQMVPASQGRGCKFFGIVNNIHSLNVDFSVISRAVVDDSLVISIENLNTE
jgi:hypothetical protein